MFDSMSASFEQLAFVTIAWQALQRNKLRSFLTTLGIIIGVFAVIATVAVGEGAQAAIHAAFASMGSNILVVRSGGSKSGGVFGEVGSMASLTWDDLRAIRTEVPAVRFASPILHTGAQVQSEERNWGTSVNGVAPDYFDIREWPVVAGRLFTPSDVDSGTKVAVLGQTVAAKLFGVHGDAVDQTVRVKGVPFQVVGVLAKKGQSVQGQDNDDAVFIPHSTFQSKIQGGLQKYIQGSIMIGATSPADTQRAQRQVTALLRDRHKIEPGTDDDDFSIRDLTEITGALSAGAKAVAVLLAAVAGISLLVGGIGIMNIMLVSVTERTSEIGLRMAVGARRRNILAQFLTESVVLTLVGGAIGMLLGIVTAQLVAHRFNMPAPIRPEMVALAVGFSALIGIGFGLYPAQRAARLNPIDALRHE